MKKYKDRFLFSQVQTILGKREYVKVGRDYPRQSRFEKLYGIALSRQMKTEILLMLMSIELILAFSYLGYIIIPPISLTTMHILVIVAAMILGTAEGVAVALIFALTSMWQATVTGVQYGDLIFSPFRSGDPVRSMILTTARPLFALITGWMFSLYFRRERKHLYFGIALITVVATWLHGSVAMLFMAWLFPDSGVTARQILINWLSVEKMILYISTMLIVCLIHYQLSHEAWREKLEVLSRTTEVVKTKLHMRYYYGAMIGGIMVCGMLLSHLMSRMKIVLGQRAYFATFSWNSQETQVILQFFCAFLGVLTLIYITVRWIGEYRALQGIRVQKETDMEELLKAEKELNQRLYEQNTILEHQKTLLKEAVERAERANEESRKSAEEARAANAAKTNFLSRMTHDIRTPLNGIIGLLRIAERHPDDTALLRTNREKMMISANHLLSLINDMLQMSKLEDGDVVLAHEVINLRELSSDILAIISQRAAEEGITIRLDHPDESIRVPYVYGSSLHIRQLFLNIYGNCIKYNRVGGSVSTSIECLGVLRNTVTYRWVISDTGIGMSENFLKHIFEPFSQERTDARSVYNGTGLGMSIVKALVDKMDGTIAVKSKVGEGTVFTITLPFELAQAGESVGRDEKLEEEPAETEASIRGLHLLLAEDNALNAEIAEALLGDAGATIKIVQNGKQAIEEFAEQPKGTYDAILMDIMMPVVDGISATREIRKMAREDAKQIPIIAMTANAFEEDAKKCMEADMNAHLSKPLQMDKVIATIAKYCGREVSA